MLFLQKELQYDTLKSSLNKYILLNVQNDPDETKASVKDSKMRKVKRKSQSRKKVKRKNPEIKFTFSPVYFYIISDASMITYH